MLKIIFQKGMSGKKVFKVNSEHDFEDLEAVRLIKAGIAKPKNKKSYEALLKKIEEKEALEKEKEEKAAAVLHKEELETERAKLMSRVDEITHTLDDAVSFYKPYGALVLDLESKAEVEDETNNKGEGN